MNILKELDFKQSDLSLIKPNIFEYNSNLGSLYFIKMESGDKLKQQFYDVHRNIWNENKSEIFISIIDENKIIICDSKTRPKQENPIENVKIKSFDYGTNTEEANKYKELLKKDNLDNGFFWEFLSKLLMDRNKEKKRSPIDKDLLYNLIKTRDKLNVFIGDDKNNISQKLMDKCLFIRFIEDRLGFNKLKKVLKEENADQLLNLFKYYNGALNGDLFEEDNISINNPAVLYELNKVFGEYYVYSDGQRTLIPYKFDKISILLISHIYQKFLKKDKKEREGIVFTPENIANYIINGVFEAEDVIIKAQNGKIKILDSACGSGIFLVKSFERLLTERQRFLNKQLNIQEKSKLLKECIYGIDLDENALRVAAFSLYLKIFEGIDSKIIKEEVFNRYENGLEHFMFPGLKDNNLISANSLFDEVFSNKFDLVLGNPPWGYKFNNKDKQKIDGKWGKTVSQYQSSQCFLHQTKIWMKEETVAAIVVNISNFTNIRAKEFRLELINNYSISNFITLTKIKEITFEESDEPACILIFSLKKPRKKIEFSIPELTRFSKLTGIITIRDDDKFKFQQEKLENDILWHISLLGLNRYLDLITKIDYNTLPLENYSIIKEGSHFYSTIKHKNIENAKRKYESNKKLGPDYYPRIRSIKTVQPFTFKQEEVVYIKHGPNLHRPKNINLFQGKKLITTRSWPLKATIVEETLIFDNNFDILKLKEGVSASYLHIFQAILNSKLGYFYLGSLFRQRPEGNFSKVNKESLRKFPIPYIEDKKDIVNDIIDISEKIKKGKNIEQNRIQIDDLVFRLYNLDYFEKMQIMEYYKLQNRRKKSLVKKEDFTEYIDEFLDSFSSLIKEGYTLNTECYASDFLGALIKISFSEEKKTPKYNLSEKLKILFDIIRKDKLIEIGYGPILEERKLKIYEKNSLIIYKSNHLRDWTKTEAINDVKEEIEVIYSNLSD